MAKQTFTSGQVLTAAQMNDLQKNDYNMSVSTGTASYTLQASDKGTRRVQNMGSAGTVTVPNSTFDAGDAVWLHSIGSGTQTISAGAGLTLNSSAGTAPTLAQWEGGVVYFTSASAAIFFRGAGGNSYGVATGGTAISPDPVVGGVTYRVLQFNSTGTLTVTKSGLFDIVAISGGGGGIQGYTNFPSLANGGAGGGGIITETLTLTTDVTITVGGGGAGATTGVNGGVGANGSPSGISTRLFASGSGGGGAQDNIPSNGICGAGSTRQTATGGTAIYNQGTGIIRGYDGGSGPTGNTNGSAGGGGGAGGVGGTGSGITGGAGGAGFDVSTIIGGSTLSLGGGGGGPGSGTGGTGNGGGGNGGSNGAGSGGTINTGGGSGSSINHNSTALNGGSGVVYVRFRL
jgi:hypothetical protein